MWGSYSGFQEVKQEIRCRIAKVFKIAGFWSWTCNCNLNTVHTASHAEGGQKDSEGRGGTCHSGGLATHHLSFYPLLLWCVMLSIEQTLDSTGRWASGHDCGDYLWNVRMYIHVGSHVGLCTVCAAVTETRGGCHMPWNCSHSCADCELLCGVENLTCVFFKSRRFF